MQVLKSNEKFPDIDPDVEMTGSSPPEAERYGIGAEDGGDPQPVPVSERLLAALMIILLSPAMLVIALLVRIFIGAPVIYTGERLGLHKKIFSVCKFRTLPPHSQNRLGAMLFSESEEVITPLARFLRESRLDELPQLINILRGEMRFLGPRPERPEIYERVLQTGQNDRDYALRFSSAPGLIGVSQVLTPHSSPKQLRARLDRRYALGKQSPGAGFLVWVILSLLRRFLTLSAQYLWHNLVLLRIRQRQHEKRAQERVRKANALLDFVNPRTNEVLARGRIMDMNRDFLRARFDSPLSWTYLLSHHARVRVHLERNGCRRFKTARCRAEVEEVLPARDDTGQTDYLLSYEAESHLNRYIIDQYFLNQSIIGRRCSETPGTPRDRDRQER